MAKKSRDIIVAEPGKKRRCYESVVVPATLRNRNQCIQKGWKVLWSGDNKFCYLKPTKCSRRK